jgi:threonine/homoserine/homoserine lactone efflux protein
MNYSEALIGGLLLGLFLAISVGPTLFAIIQYSIQHSYKAGIAFILGVSFSDILYVNIANLATTWLSFLEQHQRIVGYIGSALFISMGLYGLLKKYKPVRPRRANEATIIKRSVYYRTWLSGFLMNTLNPAVIIIWIVAAAKIKDDPLNIRFVFFTTCLGLVFAADLLKVFLAEKIRNWLTLRKIMYLNKISALFILGFGFILLYRVYYNLDLGH